MIFFFYGEDTYRLKQKLKKLKEKFISASLGDTNLAILDGATTTFEEISRQILAMPFLSRSRLVIVENLLKNGRKDLVEKIPESLAKVPNSTVLVFVEEGVPDRRSALFRKLNKPGQAQEFKLLEPEQLRRWIKKEIETRGSTLDSDAISKLIEFVGNDLWRMSNELDKLIAYRYPTTDYRQKKAEDGSLKSEVINIEDIELLVNPQIQANIFDLIDKIASKNPTGATRELYKLLDSGENELYILSMIVYQYRNLLIIKDISSCSKSASWRTNKWAIAKKVALHPFVVQKSMGFCQHYTFGQLKEIYERLLDFDCQIKTGKIEPRVALELLIFKLTTH